ncbi:LysR family transcriptional regulator [Xylophilus rhododendri]|nr:LysR family transcriptional regulator [Xylophilus rhododendri]
MNNAAMNLRGIDLNLLVVFEALIEERSVTRAAARLGMTQPAVSHALKRLRLTFGGEMLVRTAHGMEPTPEAVKLATAFRAALGQIESVLNVERGFDPARARRTFHLSVSDYVGELLLPRLCLALRRTAPDIGLTVQYVGDQPVPDVIAYEGVEIHLSVESRAATPMRSQRLLEDRFMVIMRKDHPAAALPWDLDAYLAQPHLKVTGVGSNAIDNVLAQCGRARRVMMRVPSWQGMLPVIASTDLVAAIPGRWMGTQRFAEHCVARPLPIELALTLDIAWHPRNDADSGHTWFRELIRQTVEGIGA